MTPPTIPIGEATTASLKAFDGATPPIDITATGSFTAVSSNPTVISVGALTLNTFVVTAKAPGTATITYTFTNPSGSLSQNSTINPPDPPASISISYSTPTL